MYIQEFRIIKKARYITLSTTKRLNFSQMTNFLTNIEKYMTLF